MKLKGVIILWKVLIKPTIDVITLEGVITVGLCVQDYIEKKKKEYK